MTETWDLLTWTPLSWEAAKNWHTLNRAGQKPLTWCTTEQGSKVTAVGLEAMGRPGDR